MKVIRKGKETDIYVITYFRVNKTKNNRYILYADNDDNKIKHLYLASATVKGSTITLTKPNEDDMELLKLFVEKFLDRAANLILFKSSEYIYIDINELNDKIIQENGCQKIKLSKEKYITMLSSKFLTYPIYDIIHINEVRKEGYDKNNKIAKQISILALEIYYIMLLIIQMILKSPMNDIFALNSITIIMWSVAIILISMTAFNFQEKNIFETWLFVYLVIVIFLILLNLVQMKFIIPTNVLMALVYSIIFVIPYQLAKNIAFYVVDKTKSRNYLTYYSVFLLPFFISILISISIYNTYFANYIDKIVAMF